MIRIWLCNIYYVVLHLRIEHKPNGDEMSQQTKKKYEYVYNCVAPSDSSELEYIIDNMREVTVNTVLRKLSVKDLNLTALQLINDALMYNLRFKSVKQLKKDWAMRYYVLKCSKRNLDVVVVKNSGIEYVFKSV